MKDKGFENTQYATLNIDEWLNEYTLNIDD